MNKHLKYLKYVLRHKWYVFQAGLKLHVPIWQLIIHDWSKFTPSEWKAYVDYFYDRKADYWMYMFDKDYQQLAFDKAWLHHQHKNPHHWQHWVLRQDSGATLVLEMPERYVKEMVADWMGAGRAINGKMEVGSWYRKNKDKILLHEKTRFLVELIIQGVEENEGVAL
jgi:hypothetical protein